MAARRVARRVAGTIAAAGPVPRRLWAGLAICLALALAACKYDPQLEDGSLRCSTAQECPDGFVCRVNFCYLKRPASVLPRDYIGTWMMDFSSTVSTACDDGFSSTVPISDNAQDLMMAISAAGTGPADLDSVWLCALPLRITTTGAHLTGNGVDPDCTFTNTISGLTQTWTSSQFDFDTSDGMSARHAATYARTDELAGTADVHCTQHVQAALTRL